MSSLISKRDIRLLSAYIDGRLTEKQKRDLESRLAQDSGLQSGLNDLRNTKEILRRTPELAPPRNFILVPSMVSKIKFKFNAHMTMQFASVMASVLFAVVVIGDLFVINPPRAAAPALQSEAVNMDHAAEAPMASEEDGGEASLTYTEKMQEPPSPSAADEIDDGSAPEAELDEDADAVGAAAEGYSAVDTPPTPTGQTNLTVGVESTALPTRVLDSGEVEITPDVSYEYEMEEERIPEEISDPIETSDVGRSNWLSNNIRLIEFALILIAVIGWAGAKAIKTWM